MGTEHLDGGAVAEVARLAHSAAELQSREIDGVTYFDRKLHDVRTLENLPQTIALSSLSCLAAFVRAKQDQGYTEERGAFLHVVSPTKVQLVTGIFGDFNQRAVIATAEAIVPDFRFGAWHTTEQLVIGLRTAFADSDDRATALRIVGNVKEEKTKTCVDDGVSQVVTAHTGIARVGEVEIPTTIKLRAHRSFAEVGPIEGEFILRLTGGGEGKLPNATVIEADGGAWRIAATEAVRAYLVANVPDGFPVYA